MSIVGPILWEMAQQFDFMFPRARGALYKLFRTMGRVRKEQ